MNLRTFLRRNSSPEIKISIRRAIFKDILLALFFVIFQLRPIFGLNTPSSSIGQKVLFTTISEKALWFFVSPRHHTNIIYWDQLWVKHCIQGCRQVQDYTSAVLLLLSLGFYPIQHTRIYVKRICRPVRWPQSAWVDYVALSKKFKGKTRWATSNIYAEDCTRNFV